MSNDKLFAKFENGLRALTPLSQLQFEVHVTEHCNLNCRQCSHFSPLAEETFLDVQEYERDVNRLSELFDGEASTILLLGGEPLLHSQLTDVMGVTRKAFPDARIRIITNGILLPKMTEEFWRKCRELRVEISPSEYPIKFDYEGWGKILRSKGVKYRSLAPAQNTMDKVFPICPSRCGEYDINFSNFLRCGNGNRCITLRAGRMYTCFAAAHAKYLKKYFDLDLRISKRDSVDIYAVKSGEELLEKLAKPIPFCNYCDVAHSDGAIRREWGVTHKDRYEWLAFEFAPEDISYLKEKQLDVYVFGAGQWGYRTVHQLQDEGIEVKFVLVTRNAEEKEPVYGVPVVNLENVGSIRKESICLVALSSSDMKIEVYPVLSGMDFGDIVPVFGLN